MSPLPFQIAVFFLFTTLASLALLFRIVHGARHVLIVAILWLLAQAGIALSGFYRNTETLPPHLALAIVPPLIAIVAIMLTSTGRNFLDGVSLKWSVLAHSIRILVELNLYWLFLLRQVPRLMTFEGGNLDILAGLTAPVVWWAFQRGKISRHGLIFWNFIALLSVLNAVTRALLSAPFRFQQFAFDQPTVAILTFPFALLPAFVVPVVLFAHIAVFWNTSKRPTS